MFPFHYHGFIIIIIIIISIIKYRPTLRTDFVPWLIYFNIEQLHFTGYIQGVISYLTDKRRPNASVSFY